MKNNRTCTITNRIMKTNVIRLQALSLLVMAALLLPRTLMAQDSKTNFTGSWTYNSAKSTGSQPQGQPQGQGQLPGGQGRGGFGGGDLTVTQEGNLLTVERTMTGPDGMARTTASKYTLDGKESINTTRMGESKSYATWSPDGKKLTIKTSRTMNRNGGSTTITSIEVWSLTDGKTLQIETATTTPSGERKQTSVYIKK